MSDYPPYNRNASCSKCGFGHITTTHVPVRRMRIAGEIHQVDPEHMLRECPNCGHFWKETPLDQVEQVDGE